MRTGKQFLKALLVFFENYLHLLQRVLDSAQTAIQLKGLCHPKRSRRVVFRRILLNYSKPLISSKGYFLFFLLLCTHSEMQAQKISFKIVIWGDSIGRMDVMHYRDKDSNDVYTIESKSLVKVLWIQRDGYSKFEAVCKNNKLISSSHLEIENRKTKRSTKVKFDGRAYQVSSLELGSRSFTETPVHSDASIYFSDCRKVDRIFYLPDAGFYEVKHTDPNTIEFKSADGHRNIFLLENGKIKAMEFRLPLATVYMTRIS